MYFGNWSLNGANSYNFDVIFHWYSDIYTLIWQIHTSGICWAFYFLMHLYWRSKGRINLKEFVSNYILLWATYINDNLSSDVHHSLNRMAAWQLASFICWILTYGCMNIGMINPKYRRTILPICWISNLVILFFVRRWIAGLLLQF